MSTDSATTVTPDLLARHREYQALVGRLRDLVHRTVPPGATVVVISKGDADLVSLVGRRGWHFPQDASGGYAGYHPRESTSAIEELEALRSRGADYLVLPATSNWWLEHYADFGNHLRLNYDTLVDQPDTGIIYTLRKQSAPSVVHDGSAEKELEQHRAALLAEQIEDLVAHLVSPEQPVVVVVIAASGPVQLEGRVTMPLHVSELPPAGRAPSFVAGLVARLETLRRQGATCLIIPRSAFDWWALDVEFRLHVEQEYRCITQQAHVCVIYDLEPAEEAAT
jgi:hypothetical protein